MVLLSFWMLAAAPATGQQWSADVYAGGTRYDALASTAGAASLVANLRAETRRLFAYVSAAAPLQADAPLWGALGGGTRITRTLQHGLSLGMDVDGDAYVFRHRDTPAGHGFTTHVLPHVTLARARTAFQLRAGRHDHHLDTGDGLSGRHLYEAAARVTAGDIDHFAIADVRLLAGHGERYPVARVQAGTRLGSVRVRGLAGRWFGSDLSEWMWGASTSIDIGSRGELWAAVRRDAADPLYVSSARTSWNLGYSLKLGGTVTAMPAPELRDGRMIVRLPRSAVRAADRAAVTAGAPTDVGGAAPAGSVPSIAGEFSDWRPVPMQRAADGWVIDLAVPPGVYRFSFVTAAGEWFVPEGYPGRMDDDMGGHVAVIVVP